MIQDLDETICSTHHTKRKMCRTSKHGLYLPKIKVYFPETHHKYKSPSYLIVYNGSTIHGISISYNLYYDIIFIDYNSYI
jgi:hypothetical protein